MAAESKESLQIKENFMKLESLQGTLYAAGKNGIKVEDLAKRQDVSVRTIERWIESVEKNDVFPIWYDEDAKTCGVMMDRYLPPFHLRTKQALYIFLACRMLIDSYNRYDPELSSLLVQLSTSLPNTIKKEVDKTLAESNALPMNMKYTRNIELLAQAWIEGKSVDIAYRSGKDTVAKRRIIDIYFMQPSHQTTYVIGYCHTAKDIRVFKTERIEMVLPLKDTYEIPESFNANAYLSSAWGIMRKDPEIVKLKVSKEAVPFITESNWHKTQKNEISDDGAVVTFNVGVTDEVVNWIMQWGELVEVIEPQHLRDTIIQKIEKLSELYRK